MMSTVRGGLVFVAVGTGTFKTDGKQFMTLGLGLFGLCSTCQVFLKTWIFLTDLDLQISKG